MLLQMQASERSRVILTDPLQSSAFSNPLRVRVLMACAMEACSLSQLHHQIEAPLATLHYHVSRLLAAELLTVSRTQRRAGRPIRFYRAVADSFVVPQDSLGALPGDRLSAQLRQSLKDEQSRSGELSLLYTSAPGGKVLAKLLPQVPATSSRGLELWMTINLNARQRASLAKDLREVLERYNSAGLELGAEAFLIHAAFAPRPPPT